MASRQDYRKPRNKELRDLVWNLPHPLRVKDSEGRVLWQNRLAEELEGDGAWNAHSVSWQNHKAVLEIPEELRSEAQDRVDELEAEVARLKKQQRQTARKKRRAEKVAKQKGDEQLEKQLRSRVAELEKKLGKLPKQLEDLTAENQKLKAQVKESKADSRQSERVAELERELKWAREESAHRLEDVERRQEENARQADALLKAMQQISELEERLAKAGEPGKELQDLKEDKAALETWVEELEQKKEAAEKLAAQKSNELEELEKAFADFKEQVEIADSEREVQDQLAAKVAELEALETALEREQQTFEKEKSELLERLASQEAETESLKAGVTGSQETAAVVGGEDLEELKQELEEVKTDLQLSQRKEKRLTDKVKTLEELREEHAKVLKMLREDLEESREHERELKSTLKLYAEFNEEMDRVKSESKSLKEEVERLKSVEAELKAKLEAGPKNPVSASGEDLSVSVKNQIEFLQKRLAGTEKDLDAARADLKREKAQNQSSKESEKLAFQDVLTGLPNKHMIDRYLGYAHHTSRSAGKALGLFLIDITGFRLLNKTYGWEWGDSLLKAVGERLNSMRGSSHMVARLGQDQFLLLAADLDRGTLSTYVQDASRSLLEALSYPFEVEGEEVKLTGAVGVSLGPLEGDSSQGLYDQAFKALREAKRKGTSKFATFDENLKQSLQRTKTYSKQMAHAIEKDEFKAVFQPVVRLGRGITGLELLLRWEHRDQRLLEPSEFLKPALESGLIFKITERVWPKAFSRFARWRKMRPGLTLSINLSDRELLSRSLLNRAVETAKKCELEPASIIFEVRDSSRLRISSTWWRVLQEYSQAGFGLCLDDFASDASLFGTLAYGGFVQAKMRVQDEKNIRLVKAPQAGKKVLYGAKYLQNKFDEKALVKAGFDLAQGYAVSLPLDYADVDMLLG